jgi:hypothetical protein
MTAILSKCRKYRYQLHRNVDMFNVKTIAYFGINPSTADEYEDDRTVKKWMGFAVRNECRDFFVANIYAYRATDVNRLSETDDPVGLDNDHHIVNIIEKSDVLIPCWGSRHKLPCSLQPRLDTILKKLLDSSKPVMCFGLTQSGDPKHPLMLPYDTPLIPIENTE